VLATKLQEKRGHRGMTNDVHYRHRGLRICILRIQKKLKTREL